MQEELSVFDLLECPLCLEPLDATARVLPCQHTFCKACLRKLASSCSELRCPECRALAPGGVEELPANVLLLRLLEGLQRGPRGTPRVASSKNRPHLARNYSIRRSREARYSAPRQAQGRKSTPDRVPWSRALHNYHGNLPEESSVKSGDAAIPRRKVDENGYHRDLPGTPAPADSAKMQPAPPLCRALHDFGLKEKVREDGRDLLPFFKGDVITVIRRVDESWLEGRVGDKTGVFPIRVTEPNSAAVKLLGKRRGRGCPDSRRRPTSASRDITVAEASGRRLGPGAPLSPAATPTAGTVSRLSRLPRGPLGGRQDPSVCAPTFPEPGDAGAAAQVVERRSDGYGSALFQGPTPAPAERKMVQEAPPIITMALVSPQSPMASVETQQSSSQQLSISVCATLYSYTPCRPEELELRKGEMVGVYGRFSEGWLRGLSLRTGKVGILPANYITPVLRTTARFLEPRAAPPPLSAPGGKRPVGCKPQGAGLGQDRPATNGPIRSAGHGPVVTMATQAMSSVGAGSGLANPHTLRRGFRAAHGGSSLQTISSQAPLSSSVRPQQMTLLGISPQSQGLSSVLFTPKTRSGLALSASRLPVWNHVATAPSADGSLSSEPRDAAPRGPQEKQASAHPQSILVKPDSQKNAAEKPLKSVRFLSQGASREKAKTLPPRAHAGFAAQLELPVLEAWGSLPAFPTAQAVLVDGKTAGMRRGGTVEGLERVG
ncbi:E3 ubiquitin-protein ligase SH3RF2 isoform X2 [Brienomyrus brachyistius]|uniref:E3 ubiquitin-protein ligase SH3RF2 isoform X2 n=1 Tax=Brienomyrus brachyistius TaxID=42636 RepID=UPI0020B36EF2|nr:E3 ubiquitin-protein ligase SH3RF2 isoform X2 [Brienomyrus brachyistius]